MLELPHPILTNEDLAKLRHGHIMHQRKPPTLADALPGRGGRRRAEGRARRALSSRVASRCKNEYGFIILSDRGANAEYAPVPALLATAAVHHHLDAQRHAHEARHHRRDRRSARGPPLLPAHRLRRRRGQPVRRARDRSSDMVRDGHVSRHHGRRSTPQAKYIKAINKGVLKVMSQDGHQHAAELPRRADLRSDRAVAGRHRPVLHRHRVAHRGHRPRRDRRRSA